ncbi:RCC1 domain-containing protein 1 isoform X2 [Thrips palmi]|nr:RCC1 domain-containing protein 1 isoform X2 [Thrips palmi]XP_034256019.1 RCC1 domain-containing protein 1 isoform X2 [Thrips palmi]
MTLYYCGWNGCGQVKGHPIVISTPTVVAVDGSIESVSCSWSVLSVATRKSLSMTGFVGNQHGVSKQITLGDGSNAVHVSSCLNHSLIVNDKGKCFDYNLETDTLRPLPKFTSAEYTDEEADTLDDTIVRVSCSDYSNLALTKSGKVFTIPSPISLPKLVVTNVSCGNEHCLLVTQCGSVFTWGNGSRGQLGHGDLEPEESPRIVDALAGVAVSQISAGAWHSAVVTSSGDLYTWGWGSDGQLGIKEEDGEGNEHPAKRRKQKIDSQLLVVEEREEKFRGTVQAFPLPVETPADVEQVSCGSRHTLVLLVDGTIFGCGWNAYGQLACSPDVCTRSPELRKILLPDSNTRISRIQCGGWSSCFFL